MQEKQDREPSFGAAFPFGANMDREDFLRIALRYDTLMSDAMLRALGAVRPVTRGVTTDRDAKFRKYRGARRLMAQRHGVRL